MTNTYSQSHASITAKAYTAISLLESASRRTRLPTTTSERLYDDDSKIPHTNTQ